MLPIEARVARTMHPAAAWGATEHLLADVVDLINLNTWVLICANSDKKPKAPTPIARPGMAKKAKPEMQGGKALAKLLRI